MTTLANQGNTGKHWTLLVLTCALPSVLFVALHQVIVVHYYHDSPPAVYGPDWVDRILMWPVFITGMLGPFATLVAILITVIGGFRRGVSGKNKVTMWGLVAISL